MVGPPLLKYVLALVLVYQNNTNFNTYSFTCHNTSLLKNKNNNFKKD